MITTGWEITPSPNSFAGIASHTGEGKVANEIIHYDKTKQQIADAQAVDEVLDIRAKMEALVKYFSRKLDPEQERQARELQLLAEARIGEMSLTLKKQGGPGRGNEKTRQDGESFSGKIETLKSTGLSTEQASRFERLSKLPKDELAKAARNGKSARSVLKKLSPSELKERGFSPKSERRLDPETGETVSRTAAMKLEAKAEGKAEAAIAVPIPIDTFSMSVQEKIEAWKRQQLKEMEANFENRVRAECHKQMEETFLPYYKEKEALYDSIVKTRKGMMTRGIYNKIRSCLHPDRVQDVGQKKLYEDAFRLFNDLELIFLDEKERPTSAFKMPTTTAEMMAMRKTKNAGHKKQEAI